MTRQIVRWALMVGALALSTTAGFAQEQRCKPGQTATGSASLGEAAATASAVSNWRRAVILKYGESHSDYGKARDTSKACGKTMMGLTRCEVKGAPCETASGSVGGDSKYEEACEGGGDSDRCVRVVRWVQRRLKAKGFYNKDVDGIPGEGTAAAVRKYKKSNGLGSNDEIDDALLKSLANS